MNKAMSFMSEKFRSKAQNSCPLEYAVTAAWQELCDADPEEYWTCLGWFYALVELWCPGRLHVVEPRWPRMPAAPAGNLGWDDVATFFKPHDDVTPVVLPVGCRMSHDRLAQLMSALISPVLRCSLQDARDSLDIIMPMFDTQDEYDRCMSMDLQTLMAVDSVAVINVDAAAVVALQQRQKVDSCRSSPVASRASSPASAVAGAAPESPRSCTAEASAPQRDAGSPHTSTALAASALPPPAAGRKRPASRRASYASGVKRKATADGRDPAASGLPEPPPGGKDLELCWDAASLPSTLATDELDGGDLAQTVAEQLQCDLVRDVAEAISTDEHVRELISNPQAGSLTSFAAIPSIGTNSARPVFYFKGRRTGASLHSESLCGSSMNALLWESSPAGPALQEQVMASPLDMLRRAGLLCPRAVERVLARQRARGYWDQLQPWHAEVPAECLAPVKSAFKRPLASRAHAPLPPELCQRVLCRARQLAARWQALSGGMPVGQSWWGTKEPSYALFPALRKSLVLHNFKRSVSLVQLLRAGCESWLAPQCLGDQIWLPPHTNHQVRTVARSVIAVAFDMHPIISLPTLLHPPAWHYLTRISNALGVNKAGESDYKYEGATAADRAAYLLHTMVLPCCSASGAAELLGELLPIVSSEPQPSEPSVRCVSWCQAIAAARNCNAVLSHAVQCIGGVLGGLLRALHSPGPPSKPVKDALEAMQLALTHWQGMILAHTRKFKCKATSAPREDGSEPASALHPTSKHYVRTCRWIQLAQVLLQVATGSSSEHLIRVAAASTYEPYCETNPDWAKSTFDSFLWAADLKNMRAAFQACANTCSDDNAGYGFWFGMHNEEEEVEVLAGDNGSSEAEPVHGNEAGVVVSADLVPADEEHSGSAAPSASVAPAKPSVTAAVPAAAAVSNTAPHAQC